MVHNQFIKESLYTKLNERRQISESNKRIKRLADQSREKLRKYQKILNQNSHKPDRSQKSRSLNKSFNSLNQRNVSEPGPIFKKNIIYQISTRASEYEKAIQQYLGINHKDIKIEKLKKIKEIKDRNRNRNSRSNSSVDLAKEETKDRWDDELRKIELQEKNIEKNLSILSVKQKNLKIHSKSVKAPIKASENIDIFKSLEQVNKLLTNVLKTNNKVSLKKK